MIVLDTNVVSEPMRPQADPVIKNWLDQQVAETLYLTATSLSELLVGIEFLPKGRRKEGLDAFDFLVPQAPASAKAFGMRAADDETAEAKPVAEQGSRSASQPR